MLLIVVLILLLVFVFPHSRYNRDWGYMPSGLIGFILVVILILFALGRIPAGRLW